jgi:hypothetical protein
VPRPSPRSRPTDIVMVCAERRERANAGSREAHSHRQTAEPRAAWVDSVDRSPGYVGSGGACKLSYLLVGSTGSAGPYVLLYLLHRLTALQPQPTHSPAAWQLKPSHQIAALLFTLSSVRSDRQAFSRIRFDARTQTARPQKASTPTPTLSPLAITVVRQRCEAALPMTRSETSGDQHSTRGS